MSATNERHVEAQSAVTEYLTLAAVVARKVGLTRQEFDNLLLEFQQTSEAYERLYDPFLCDDMEGLEGWAECVEWGGIY